MVSSATLEENSMISSKLTNLRENVATINEQDKRFFFWPFSLSSYGVIQKLRGGFIGVDGIRFVIRLRRVLGHAIF